MTNRLHDLVMDSVSTVDWPGAGRIRSRVRRRRAARVAGGGLAAVLVVVALVWAGGPMWTDAAPRPADSPHFEIPPGFEPPSPELLRGEDVGPGYEVNAWGSRSSSEGGTRVEDFVLAWPTRELAACPARAAKSPPPDANGLRPDDIQMHEGGENIRADPLPGNTGLVSLEEELLRYADDSAAGRVLAEARQIAADCASFTGGLVGYSLAVTAEDFAGDESVQVDVTEARSPGVPATHAFLFVRVGSVVILISPSLTADSEWLRGVARSAVSRYCDVSGKC